jgi:hypothetical protein
MGIDLPQMEDSVADGAQREDVQLSPDPVELKG